MDEREAARQLLDEISARVAVAEIAEPHCFICFDPQTSREVVVGPFPTADEALVAGEAMRAEFADDPQGPPMQIRVAAIFAPSRT